MHRSLEELVEKYTRARDRFRAKRRELGDIARETSFYRDAVAFYEQLQQEPRFRKMADLAENVESSQFMFTLSLSLLMLTQYIAVAAPEHFYYLYAAII